jgi:hypothetical protein
MSSSVAVVLTGVAVAVALGTYAFALHRYEVGRKVPFLFWQTKVRWPYRRTRFPAWVQIVQWSSGALVAVAFLRVMSEPAAGTVYFQQQMRAAGTILALVIAMLAGQALMALLHNRGSASYPASGWYYDPDDVDMMRWWNGVEWLEYTFPKDRVAPDPYAPTTAE